MKRWWNIAFQVVATAAQVWQITEPTISWEGAQQIGAGIAMAQAIMATVAHNYNPDGTTAKVAYTPEAPIK